MVNNYDRIFTEIEKEAARVAAESGLRPEAILALTMEIVNLEDDNRIKPTNIKQLVEAKILSASLTTTTSEEK